MMTSLKDIRTERGLSQEALAELVGVSRQTVSKWETGTVQPSAENLKRLSQVFQLPTDAFLKEDWTPTEQQVVEAAETPAEMPAEPAVEVLPPRRHYRLWAALAAAIAAAGIIAGVISFSGGADGPTPISESEIEGKEVDRFSITERITLHP